MSRHRRLQAPTQLAETIFRAAEALLITEVKGVSYRLIGVGVEGLCDAELADHPDLFSDAPKHAAGVEKAMDAVRARFGRKAIGKGRAARTK